MRWLWIAALLAACGNGSAADGGGSCKQATDCPAIDCQCVGGSTVPSYCLCQGGIATNGNCGPGGVCAQTSDCSVVCSDVNGPGGGSSGSGTTGGSGGGPQCASTAQCGLLPCCADGGMSQTYCLQGQCTCPAC